MIPKHNHQEEPLILLLERNVLTGAAIALVLVMLVLLTPGASNQHNCEGATVPLLMLPLLVDLEDASYIWYGAED